MATVVYLNSYMQLLAHVISLLLEAQLFCQSPLKSKPMLWLSLLYMIAAYGTSMAPLQSLWTPLYFYDFSHLFRWLRGCAIIITTMVYHFCEWAHPGMR